MQYFFIQHSNDKNIIGINDGGDQAEIVESRWKNKANLKRYNEEYILGIKRIEARILKGEQVQPPVIEYIKVRPKAVLTDFMSFSEGYPGGRFLVSGKAKEVLESYNLKCLFYSNIGLYQMDKKVEGYSNFHLFPLKGELAFEFEHCIFYNGLRFDNGSARYATSFNEYVSMAKEGRVLNMEHLTLKQSEVGKLDMFTFDIHPGMYISDRLKKSFEAAGVTGIDYHTPTKPTLNLV